MAGKLSCVLFPEIFLVLDSRACKLSKGYDIDGREKNIKVITLGEGNNLSKIQYGSSLYTFPLSFQGLKQRTKPYVCKSG